jgi:hypothetical protein
VTREWPDLFETAERDREITAIGEQLVRLESETSKLEARMDRLLSAQETMLAGRSGVLHGGAAMARTQAIGQLHQAMSEFGV